MIAAMDVKKHFFPSHKFPKYDIYDRELPAVTSSNRGIQPKSDNSFIRDLKSIPQTNGPREAKGPFHSTPLDRNMQRQISFPSVTSISLTNPKFSPENGSRVLKIPNKKASFASDFSATQKQTPKFQQRSGSARHSKGFTPVGNSTLTFTPGSSRSVTDLVPPSTIIAVVEGRGHARMEVGIAAIDLYRPLLTVVQFSDTHTYSRTLTKLTILNPLEVLFANTAEDERLIRVVRESLEGVTITSIQRKYFNETRGHAILKHISLQQCSHVTRQISSKYYCLSAVAALVRYVEQIQNVTYASHSLMVTVASSELVLTIDHESIKNLEIVRNLSKGWEESLFGVIKNTSTSSGTRMLRAALLQPFADLRIIETRLSAVQYLSRNPDLFHSLKSILGRFPDLDWILSMCVQKPKQDTDLRIEQRLNYVIGLKSTLELLHPLRMAMENIENQFYVFIREAIASDEIEALLDLLRQVLHEDARLVKGCTAMRAQRCYAIKPNINSLLDVARKIYSELIDDIIAHIEGLAANYKIPMKVGHNSTRGFHIIISTEKSSTPSLPPCFLQVQKNRGTITCTTEEIYQLDHRSRECLREILIMSNIIILELISKIQKRVGVLYGVAEAVAILDMVVGLTQTASVGSWVRPDFSTHLAIRDGRHPILDILSPIPLVANNTFLNEEKRVMVISGPNMSGKSTYLKQVALLQILAQIGSYVPADVATLKLVDHIFTLLGREDNPENNASTFEAQMNGVSNAMQLAGNRSLVILDELGQGTNIEEGTSLAWAIVEQLIYSKAFVIQATHLRALIGLADVYPQVSNFYMESLLGENKKLHLSYILRKGMNTSQNYGLALASSVPLPKWMLQKAYQVTLDSVNTKKGELAPSRESEASDTIYYLGHRLMTFAASIPSMASAARDTIDGEESHPSNQTSDYFKAVLKEMLQEFVADQNTE